MPPCPPHPRVLPMIPNQTFVPPNKYLPPSAIYQLRTSGYNPQSVLNLISYIQFLISQIKSVKSVAESPSPHTKNPPCTFQELYQSILIAPPRNNPHLASIPNCSSLFLFRESILSTSHELRATSCSLPATGYNLTATDR